MVRSGDADRSSHGFSLPTNFSEDSKEIHHTETRKSWGKITMQLSLGNEVTI
jgi:hypothetical protein